MGPGAAIPPLDQYFSPDYATARERFHRAADAAGAQLESLALAARGPADEVLAIDIAWLGAADARRILLHTSGIHGVEAYAGSAVQLALLDEPPAMGAGDAIALVHVLNPYGMAWLRRANEANVDLNRNFLGADESWSGAPPLYAMLDPLLNPGTPPRRDAFLWRMFALALRQGYGPVKQAIAQGQYQFPRGLFYGGAQLEAGPQLFRQWLERRLSHAEQVLAIDVHTGLGRWARDTLFGEPGRAAPAGLAAALGAALVDTRIDASAAYVIRGGLHEGIRSTLGTRAAGCVLQEFGTYSMLHVISALREENRWHFYGTGDPGHPAKAALLEALCPKSRQWRARVVARGAAVARGGVKWLTDRSSDDL